MNDAAILHLGPALSPRIHSLLNPQAHRSSDLASNHKLQLVLLGNKSSGKISKAVIIIHRNEYMLVE